jgi:myo-inositol-1(or 4)-monophosphatase
MKKNIKEKNLKIAMRSALKAGEKLIENFNTNINVVYQKNKRDITTKIDFEAEKIIFDIISKKNKNQAILFEEKGFIGKKKKNFWIVDALDGTVNYLNQIPIFATSIAYYEKKEFILGCIYNPLTKELYYSCEKNKVFKNSLKLKIKKKSYENSLFAMSFSGQKSNAKIRNKEAKLFMTYNDSSRGCLRTGSLAVNLGYFCEGKLDGCIGHEAKIWDAAAGLSLAKNIGAKISYKISKKNRISFIVGNELNFTKIKRYYEEHIGKI